MPCSNLRYLSAKLQTRGRRENSCCLLLSQSLPSHEWMWTFLRVWYLESRALELSGHHSQEIMAKGKVALIAGVQTYMSTISPHPRNLPHLHLCLTLSLRQKLCFIIHQPTQTIYYIELSSQRILCHKGDLGYDSSFRKKGLILYFGSYLVHLPVEKVELHWDSRFKVTCFFHPFCQNPNSYY